MKLKYKKLSENAKAPQKFHETDAGYDITATSKAIRPFYIEYGTDLCIRLPKNHIGLLFPRSSITSKPLTLANSVGVIDEDFQGEIKVRFRKTVGASVHTDSEAEMYKVGDRICQLVVLKLPELELEEIEDIGKETVRGTGGFGSTNKKKTSKKVVKKVEKEDDKTEQEQ